MTYVDAYVLAVKTDQKDSYKAMAEEVWPQFSAAGALALHEFWGDDVPEGKVTSFPMAVKCEPDETVVFGWVEWPDRATRDAGNAALEAQHAKDMEQAAQQDAPQTPPVDPMRMIWGGFAPLISRRAGG